MRSPAGHTRYKNVNTADRGPVVAQTRTLAAADGAVNVQQVGLLDKPDLDPNLRPAARTQGRDVRDEQSETA
jgi:hypothetical protein